MKRTFLVSTERGRVKHRISFYIAEIIPNEGLKLIDNDYTCSLNSNRGLRSETVNVLVNKGILPKTAIDESGYPVGNLKDDSYNLIIVEGQGLNYINQY